MENTFDVKWYEDSALAYWVKQKVLPSQRFQFDGVVADHEHEIIEFGDKIIDFNRALRWVMFTWGWAIETCYCNKSQVTTVETLLSYNGRTATIIHRSRFGTNHHKMVFYTRDNIFPVPSIVRLLPCSLQSSCHTPAFANA